MQFIRLEILQDQSTVYADPLAILRPLSISLFADCLCGRVAELYTLRQVQLRLSRILHILLAFIDVLFRTRWFKHIDCFGIWLVISNSS